MAQESKSAPEVDKATGATLQTQADVEALAKAKAAEDAKAAQAVMPGSYVVSPSGHVRSLDKLFKPGEDFTGAVGDIPGLVASGALMTAADYAAEMKRLGR